MKLLSRVPTGGLSLSLGVIVLLAGMAWLLPVTIDDEAENRRAWGSPMTCEVVERGEPFESPARREVSLQCPDASRHNLIVFYGLSQRETMDLWHNNASGEYFVALDEYDVPSVSPASVWLILPLLVASLFVWAVSYFAISNYRRRKNAR
jgi:hypothetical protein